MRGIGGYTHAKNAVYAGGIPVFYRVNPWESGCYNTVKPVGYTPYYRDLDLHTFGCQFFCYKKIDTSPILRIVECIKELVTTYIIKGLPSPPGGLLKKNYKKNLYMKKSRLMELASLDEFISTPEKEAAKKAFGKTDQVTAQAIEDGYYALTDNLPNLINDLEKAAKQIQAVPPYSADELKIIKNEAKIYRQVQELIDKSVLGSIL